MTRYTRIAIGLHWLIAVAIITNLILGCWMSDAINHTASRDSAFRVFQWHKSIGLTILLLSVLRLTWRILNPPPPLPKTIPPWEQRAAAWTHSAFYTLMIGVPLSGWLYVSSQWRGDAALTIPTLWFEWFEVPHLFGLNEASHAQRQSIASISLEAHEVLVWCFLLLLLLHIGAALRHQFVLKDKSLVRILPQRIKSQAPQPKPPSHSFTRTRLAAASLCLLTTTAFIYIGTQAGSTLQASTNTGRMDELLRELVKPDNSQAQWLVNKQSHIRFAGSHVGREFTGEFTQWRAFIQFDPASPGQAQIAAVIETASATDGNPIHDSTLPKEEWFDASSQPFAHFRVTRVEPTQDNYLLFGQLTIKNHSVELAPLTMTIKGANLEIRGTTLIDRADVHMGMESDPAGDYVSRDITIRANISATPAE
ncbi:MAG: cytochrome b561/polyisoprenoid-binding protein YceI [Bermanella sp.]